MTALYRMSAVAALVLAAGCAGGAADVSGKVTYQGKPVVFGTVVLIGPDGVPKSAPIQPDGTYRITGAKLGTAKVAVTSPPPPGATPAGKSDKPGAGKPGDDDKPPVTDAPADPAVAKAWFPLPDKFGDPLQSGLTATVGSGKPVDLDLK